MGSASFSGSLGPGAITDYYSTTAGANTFQAQWPDGSLTGSTFFDITQGSSCTVTLSDNYQASISLSNFAAGGTITINGVTFFAIAGATSSPSFSVAGSDSADLDALFTCINAAVISGVSASEPYTTSTTVPIVITSAPAGGSCTPSYYYVMMVSLKSD